MVARISTFLDAISRGVVAAVCIAWCLHAALVPRPLAAQMQMDPVTERNSALRSAVESGDAEAVLSALADGADPNMRSALDGFVMPMLTIAAFSGSTDVVSVLLEHGADPDAALSDGGTALHVSARSGSLEMVEVLLRNDADPNAVVTPLYGPSQSALHLAAGDTAVVDLLIKNGATVGVYDLNAALSRGDVPLVRLLLQSDVDVNGAGLVDGRGDQTPLMAAVGVWPDEVGALLVRRGAEFVSEADYLEAVEAVNIELVSMLLGAGADVNAIDDEGRTALTGAAEESKTELVEFLLQNGADVKAGSERSPVLVAAAASGSVELGNLLLQAGADVNASGAGGQTPLLAAARRGDPEIVQLLLAHGADQAAVDGRGRTAVEEAVSWGHDEVVILLADGPDFLRPVLRDLANSQEIFYADHYAYTTSISELEFAVPDGVTVNIVEASQAGWAAVATHADLGPDQGCAVFYGTAESPTIGGVTPDGPMETVCSLGSGR